MIFLFRLKIMTFKITEVIFSIFLLCCYEEHKKAVKEIAFDIFFIAAVPCICIKRICHFKFFISNKFCYESRIGNATSAISTNINNKILCSLLLYFFKGLPEKGFKF